MPPTFTWTFDSAEVNGEGTQLILAVTVSGNKDDFPVGDPLPDGSSVTLAGITQIDAYRFDPGTLAITEQTTGATTKRSIYDLLRVDGSTTTTITFKIGLDLLLSRSIAAYSDPASNVASVSIGIDAITIGFNSGSILGPHAADAVDLDVSKVGRMPDTTGFPLALHCDVQAEYVQRDGVTGALASWTNIDNPASSPAQSDNDQKPQLSETGDVPVITFGPGGDPDDWRNFAWASPIAITEDATYAVVIRPGSSDSSNLHHIVGRFDQNGASERSWRVGWDGDNEPSTRNEMLLTTRNSGQNSTLRMDVKAEDDAILLVLRRSTLSDEATIIYDVWINGRQTTVSGSLALAVDPGDGPVTVGARRNNSGALIEGFHNQINQIVLYPAFVGDLALSLVVHQMALHAGIDLGTPVSETTQPFTGAGTAVGERPIAVMNLSSAGMHDGNYWGQADGWRNGTQADIEAFLKGDIQVMLNACSDYEIMFNRPGGTFKEDIVPTYIFGSAAGQGDQVQEKQWDAMRAVWDHFGFDRDNTNGRRRAWFYTGGGLPVNDDGTLNTEGRMHNRVVTPLTPDLYVTHILSEWPARDDSENPDVGRYRCLFLDAATKFYGKFIELCHSNFVKGGNFYLVSEAISTDPAARQAGPFFAILDFGRGPWWNINDNTGLPDKNRGYNTQWRVENGEVVFFGVSRGGYPYLYFPGDPPLVKDGSNLTLGNIYRFIHKGAVPVAWQNVGVYRRVGAAWDYAKQRIPNSRLSPSPRILRMTFV